MHACTSSEGPAPSSIAASVIKTHMHIHDIQHRHAAPLLYWFMVMHSHRLHHTNSSIVRAYTPRYSRDSHNVLGCRVGRYLRFSHDSQNSLGCMSYPRYSHDSHNGWQVSLWCNRAGHGVGLRIRVSTCTHHARAWKRNQRQAKQTQCKHA
jgi:hypothetical protein